MDRSDPQNGRRREIRYPGSNVYGPKQKSKEKLEVLLPTESEIPDHIYGQWPAWLEDLLSGVLDYNSERNCRAVFFCVSCRKVVYENELFEIQAAYHRGHRRLRTYDYESSICVNSADIKVLGVDTQDVQQFRWSAPKTDSSPLFVFLHNTFQGSYAYKPLSMAASWKNCAHCHSWLQSVQDWTKTRFCCLHCKFEFMKGAVTSEQESLLPLRLSSIPETPPSDYDLTSGAVTIPRGIGYKKPPRHILTNGTQCSGCNDRHSVASPKEPSGWHMAAHELSSHDSKVRVRDTAGDDDSFVFDTDAAEELSLCHLDAALHQYHIPSRSRQDDSESTRIMSELYSFLPDSVYPFLPGFEDEMTTFRDSNPDLELGRRSSKRHKTKCQLVQPLQVVPRTPTDVFGTMVSSIGDSRSVGCRAAEQYFRTGSELAEKCGAVVDQDHSHDPAGHASVSEHIRKRREVDKIGLPEVLYEDDQLDALLSLQWEEIQSTRITTPHGSPANSAEEIIYKAANSSFADSKPVKNPVQGKKCIPIGQPECMVPNTSSFRTALAAASCSSNDDEPQWWHHKVSAVAMGDWDVEGEGMAALERLPGQTPKALDDNVLRKANFLLRSFGCTEFETNQPVRDDDDTNSTESSSSSGETAWPELSMIGSPKVQSFKVDGSIDFTSLKQLMSTFDPRSWMISDARSPEQVPGTGSPWSASLVL